MWQIGRPDDEFLNQPITAMDHPILRSHAGHDPQSSFVVQLNTFSFFIISIDLRSGSEAQSQIRRPGETELDYYERRYQERVKTRFEQQID